ncbi:MAG TPA: hypothetical protein PKY64_06840 [Anaerolineaceae bacterium]|nr:hypothetical protein [Anaerolineaceae bacterium]
MAEFDLQKLEERFSQLLGNQRPRSSYVKRLKDELKNSRIFEYRRSIGAILVASLGVVFAGALSFSIALLAQKARRRLSL